jgi:hypothetical protein
MARNNYEPINDTRGVVWGIEAGALENKDLYQADSENPFGSNDVRIHRSSSSLAPSDPSRRRFLWWVLGPAVTLLVVIAVAVAVISQSAVPLPASAGSSPNMPTLAAEGPSSTGRNNNMLPSTYATVDESSTDTSREGAVDSINPTTTPAQKPGSKMNATTVLSCLKDKCEPFVNQLGKSWDELANINLLRCLASSAFNKTEAGGCFDHARPSDLRDDLVACAGCNKCIKLKDQAGVDKACAKYNAWAAKQKADATAPTLETAVEEEKVEDNLVLLQQSPSADSLASNLPASLKEKFCSQYWCP